MRQLRPPISLSLFDLLKAGPGPSSSHTIAPMKAGFDFYRRVQSLPPDLLQKVQGVRVRLLGSLSATGRGHGTDRAVVAGLMGYTSETCPPDLLPRLFTRSGPDAAFSLPGKDIALLPGVVFFGPIEHDHPYSNTFFIDLLDCPFPAPRPADSVPEPKILSLPQYKETSAPADLYAGNILYSMEYYSVGGGFLQWKGQEPEERGAPEFPYVNMRELRVRLVQSGLPLDALMLRNEAAITGVSEVDARARLDGLLELMREAVRRGCAASGELPGIGLFRKAGVLRARAASLSPFDQALCLLNAYAYAAAEENAAGSVIVTAPTCGAAGVVPAVLTFMTEQAGLDAAACRRGLLAAAAVGFIAKQNAGIAGAEVGCQGEIGVAAGMAAAMLAHAKGFSAAVVENAAEIALEHHLGLTCDPVGGFVQIPCIERNAVGAVKAYNAALIACNENPAAHMVSFDDVLQAMAEIGRDMNAKYKETSRGGLAVSFVAC